MSEILATRSFGRLPAAVLLGWLISTSTLARGEAVQNGQAGQDPPENLAVLSPDPERPQTEEMMRSYLRGLAHEAFDRRLERYESLQTPEQIAEYQQSMRRFFLEQLGGFPERTPLDAKVVGRKTYDDYRMEKVVYQSRPGFYTLRGQ